MCRSLEARRCEAGAVRRCGARSCLRPGHGQVHKASWQDPLPILVVTSAQEVQVLASNWEDALPPHARFSGELDEEKIVKMMKYLCLELRHAKTSER